MRLTTLACAAAMSIAAPFAAACDNPPLVMIPEAGEAEGQEQRVRNSVGEYYTALQSYTACLQSELEAAESAGAPELARSLLVQRNNAAVAEAEAVITLFNELAGELGWESADVADN